ncbi:MAG: C4-type zinc ribbon domain-containing protein [Gemmatimonadota bacterium]|nr:C4-type zinc ribbon domain-containing protein [Gemmatimonadota bacterium]
MKEGLQQLLKLQEVDKKLFALEEAKEKYPAEIDLRRSRIAKARSVLADLEGQSAEFEKQQRHCEREIESGKATLREREERFAVVTTNKEYDSLQLEIEICKQTIAEQETLLIKALEGLEQIQEQIAEEQSAFEEVREAEQERIDELEGQLGTMQEQIDEVATSRQVVAQVIEGIDAQLLRTYERKKGRRGIRVAAVRKEACGACYHQMPAQVRNEVRVGDRVIYCESCGTIMVWDEQSV